jgi:hypothetical protein
VQRVRWINTSGIEPPRIPPGEPAFQEEAMSSKRNSAALFVLTVALFAATYLSGQAVNNSQMHGTVTDPAGAVVAGAQIKATQTSTGQARTTTTGSEGAFTLPNLPVGPYTLEVTAQGFQSYRQTGIVLQVSENPKIDVTLRVGTVTQTEEVHSDAVMVKTDETSISEVIDHERIVDLPLDGRQVTQLILLSGAAVSTPTLPNQDLLSSKNYGNGNATMSSNAAISVAGGQVNANSYLLDGGDHVDKFSNLNMPLPFPDAIQEFSVQTSTLTARYGVHSGSAINVITKSGTNAWHGDIFEFIRNDFVNAHHWLAPTNFLNTGVPATLNPNDNALRRNQFGGTLGGPIVHNKVMLFLGYQGTRNFQTPAPTTIHVPTPQSLATGDFSSLESQPCTNPTNPAAKPRVIKNPKTSATFTNGQVPTNLFTSQALTLLKLVPTSTDPCGTLTQAVPNTGDEDQGIARIDWTKSDKNTIFGRYFISDFRDAPIFDGKNILTTTKAGQFARHQSLVLGNTYSLSSTKVNSIHVTASRTAVFRGPAGNMITPATLGVNVPAPIPNDLVISIGNYFNVEGGTQTVGHFNTNSLQVADDFDWMHGKHQIAFGANWIHGQLNELSTNNANGNFQFATGGTGSSGDALVDFLLGDISTFTQANNEQENWRQNYFGLYVQDNYRVRHNLTLNAGVRWDPYIPAQDRYHRGAHFDPAAFAAGTTSTVFPNAPPGLFFCGDAQTPCSYVKGHLLNFSPRVGFNWDPRGKGKETIRAGYGLFYDNPELFYFDRFADDSPFGSSSTLSRPGGGFANPYQGQAVPAFPLPFPTSSANAVFVPFGTYINEPLNLRPTYVQTWNLAFEKQVGADWLFTASYLGNRTNHLWLAYEANAPVFIPGNSTSANENTRRPLFLLNPGTVNNATGTCTFGSCFGSIAATSDEGNASYNALLLSARHRFHQNFTLLANYTYSHCIDLGEFLGELANSRLVSNSSNVAGDRGNCGFDLRHNFNASLVANSPSFGKHLTNILLGGWRFSTIAAYHTGLWFSPTHGGDNSLFGTRQDRADLVAGQDPFNGSCSFVKSGVTQPTGSVGCWFNTAAFTANGAGATGNAARNMFQGPGFLQFDASLSRSFKVREGKSLTLRLDALNLLNHPNLGLPVGDQSNQNFGQITSAIGNPRILQGAAKFTF